MANEELTVNSAPKCKLQMINKKHPPNLEVPALNHQFTALWTAFDQFDSC